MIQIGDFCFSPSQFEWLVRPQSMKLGERLVDWEPFLICTSFRQRK